MTTKSTGQTKRETTKLEKVMSEANPYGHSKHRITQAPEFTLCHNCTDEDLTDED